MAVVLLHVIPSFYTKYSRNSLFVSANTYEKYIVSKENCTARHVDRICFLLNCRSHKKLIGNEKELLQEFDAFCFKYQHMDCLYKFFKYRFSGEIVVKSGHFFDVVQRAVQFNKQIRGVDRMPIITKKRLLRKRYKKYLLTSFRKTKWTQISGSFFVGRTEQVRRTKFELELIRTVVFCLDCHGNYTGSLVSFKIKCL